LQCLYTYVTIKFGELICIFVYFTLPFNGKISFKVLSIMCLGVCAL